MILNRTLTRICLTSAAALLVAASGAPAQSTAHHWVTDGASTPRSDSSVVVIDNDDTVSIRMENGKLVSVERNGKSVPLDRVKQDADNISILDEHGNVLQKIQVAVPASGSGAWARSAIHLDDSKTAPNQAKRRVEIKPDQSVQLALEAPKAMIGIQMAQPDRSLAGHFGLSPGQATMISGVYEGLPASKAGLAPYDIIVAVDGKSPAGQEDIRAYLSSKDAGDQVKLTVIQKGERREIKLSLQKYDQEQLSSAKLNAIETPQQPATWWRSPDAQPGTMLFKPGDDDHVFEFRTVPSPQDMSEHFKEFIERSMKDGPGADDARRKLLEHAKQLNLRSPAVDAPPSPAEPAVPGPRLKDLEKRMQRLEELLEKLVDRQGGGNR
ncbi:MAG: S1C family serine protease [Phycisphaerales bacterium]